MAKVSHVMHKEPIIGSHYVPYRETGMRGFGLYLWWAFCINIMHNQNNNTQTFLLLFSLLLLFLGLYIGRAMWHVDENKRVTELVSCNGYEEDFLKSVGYKDKGSCVDLNLA